MLLNMPQPLSITLRHHYEIAALKDDSYLGFRLVNWRHWFELNEQETLAILESEQHAANLRIQKDSDGGAFGQLSIAAIEHSIREELADAEKRRACLRYLSGDARVSRAKHLRIEAQSSAQGEFDAYNKLVLG